MQGAGGLIYVALFESLNKIIPCIFQPVYNNTFHKKRQVLIEGRHDDRSLYNRYLGWTFLEYKERATF